MKKLLSLGALLAALWSAQPAAAADNTVPPQLEKYVTSPAFREILGSVLDKLPPEIFPHCPALKSPGAKLTPLQPIAFAKDGTPTSGAWKQSLPVSGCGNDTILNFIFAVSPDGKIHPIALAPGYTHAEPALQRDSVTYATVAAEKLAPDCVSWQVRHTRFQAYGLVNPRVLDPGENSPTRPWWETWTMAGCGHVVDVPIDYIPQEGGTVNVLQQGDGKMVR